MAEKSKKKEVKLNLLGINRRSKHVVGCLKPEENSVFISSDISSGEPTLLLNYTNDATLKAILYDFRGKKPEWRGNLLLTDSLYITTMSKTDLILKRLDKIMSKSFLNKLKDRDEVTLQTLASPSISDEEIELLEKADGCFEQLYFESGDTAKHLLGNEYRYAKAWSLAFIYGLQASGLVIQAKDAGYSYTKDYAKSMMDAFWDTIPAVREFRDQLIAMFTLANKRGKPFISPFGLPLPTGKPRIALNIIVQSSVSSYLRRLEQAVFPCGFAELVAMIHDEMVANVLRGREADWKPHLFGINTKLNKEVGMQYPIKLGFKIGDSFYAAH